MIRLHRLRSGTLAAVRLRSTRRTCGRLLRALAARIDPPGVVPDSPPSIASGRVDLQFTHSPHLWHTRHECAGACAAHAGPTRLWP